MSWKGIKWGILYGCDGFTIFEMRTSANGVRCLAMSPLLRIDATEGPEQSLPVLPIFLGMLLDGANIQPAPAPTTGVVHFIDEPLIQNAPSFANPRLSLVFESITIQNHTTTAASNTNSFERSVCWLSALQD